MVLDIRFQLPRLGGRKLHYMLREKMANGNVKVGRDRLFDILRAEHLLVVKKHRYTKTTNSKHWMRKYPNLTRQLELTAPEQLWVADITYLQTVSGNEYLHLVTDACSKRIMGYELCTDMKTSSTKKALKMALKNREYSHELIHHSDRGLQYCCYDYTRLLLANNVKISMTENGDPYENAIAERVNGILKDEFGLDRIFLSHEQLKQHVDHAVEIYNNCRPHCSIELLTPKQAHARTTLKVKRWKTKAPSKINYDGAF